MADTKSIRVVGYAMEDEEFALQVSAFRNEGVSMIYTEKEDSLSQRPELARCLASLKEGDTLLVYAIDRIARSVHEFIGVALQVSGSGASIRSLTQPIDTSGPSGEFFVEVLRQVTVLDSSLNTLRVQEAASVRS